MAAHVIIDGGARATVPGSQPGRRRRGRGRPDTRPARGCASCGWDEVFCATHPECDGGKFRDGQNALGARMRRNR